MKMVSEWNLKLIDFNFCCKSKRNHQTIIKQLHHEIYFTNEDIILHKFSPHGILKLFVFMVVISKYDLLMLDWLTRNHLFEKFHSHYHDNLTIDESKSNIKYKYLFL